MVPDRPFTTGCSMHAKKRTVAVLGAPGASQLPAALALASRVLRVATTLNNTPSMILFGSGLSDASEGSVAHVRLLDRISSTGYSDAIGQLVNKVDIVVGADDLTLLRLVPSRHFGEVCRPPTCTTALCALPPASAELERRQVGEMIECLLRPPPIEYESIGELPAEWQEHIADLESFQWANDLWRQSLADLDKADGRDIDLSSPFDVLSLGMYYKLASVAIKTTDMTESVIKNVVASVDGAADIGLLDVFPVDGIAPRVLEFLQPYLIGDANPWELTKRGKRAAATARIVIERTFQHCEHVASILANARVAMRIRDDLGPVEGREHESFLVIASGRNGEELLATNRIPVGAIAADGKFRVETRRSTGDWEAELNAEFKELVDTIRKDQPVEHKKEFDSVRLRLAAYTAMSSRHLLVNKPPNEFAWSAVGSLITTHPVGIAAHISHELTIRDDLIAIHRTTARVALQQGTSVSCTFATFCPTMRATLSTSKFQASSIASMDLVGAQRILNSIASAMDRHDAPIGLFVGTICGRIEVDGTQHRAVSWKARGEELDSFVTFLPENYLNIAFADYLTGSRALHADELDPHEPIPFFCADTILTVFNSMALPGTNQLAYKIPKHGRAPLLADDEVELYNAYTDGLESGANRGRGLDLPPSLAGIQSVFIRESSNDRLAGLQIGWLQRQVRGETIYLLLSANSSNERVSY